MKNKIVVVCFFAFLLIYLGTHNTNRNSAQHFPVAAKKTVATEKNEILTTTSGEDINKSRKNKLGVAENNSSTSSINAQQLSSAKIKHDIVSEEQIINPDKFAQDYARTKSYGPFAKIYNAELHKRMMDLNVSSKGCALAKDECATIFKTLKEAADAGDISAKRQYGIAKMNQSRLIKHFPTPNKDISESERLSIFKEGKEYLLSTAPEIDWQGARSLSEASAYYSDPEDAIAWFLVAKRLGSARTSLSNFCDIFKFSCSNQQLFRSRDIADTYIDLYELKAASAN